LKNETFILAFWETKCLFLWTFLASILFFEMPCKILHVINIPPTTLRICFGGFYVIENLSWLSEFIWFHVLRIVSSQFNSIDWPLCYWPKYIKIVLNPICFCSIDWKVIKWETSTLPCQGLFHGTKTKGGTHNLRRRDPQFENTITNK
jgi:hypothetical protein